jgi:sugar/nucleoside kinase (ribokinase family)
MTPTRFDILGIGNAIVDVVAQVEDGFLSRHDLRKGAMTLVDAAQAEALQQSLQAAALSSGGSAANTCSIAAQLGSRVAYLGKVADDGLGKAFRRDIRQAGVHFPTAPLQNGTSTARCLVLVTPDGQRTMLTYLGACTSFGSDDVDAELIASSGILYLEGYLYDPPAAQQAFQRAAGVARQAGRRVALSLSDPFCVHRHRAAFRAFVRQHVDILVANEAELCSLYELDDLTNAIERARPDVSVAAVTRSENGSIIVSGDETAHVPAHPTTVLDTTGAGDAYAAGFLTGLTRGKSLAACGRIASLAAAAVLTQLGGRPPSDRLAEAAAAI